MQIEIHWFRAYDLWTTALVTVHLNTCQKCIISRSHWRSAELVGLNLNKILHTTSFCVQVRKTLVFRMLVKFTVCWVRQSWSRVYVLPSHCHPIRTVSHWLSVSPFMSREAERTSVRELRLPKTELGNVKRSSWHLAYCFLMEWGLVNGEFPVSYCFYCNTWLCHRYW